jgi:predicted TIM-barrel enzyme
MAHAVENVRIAQDAGADGVMLIGHRLKHQDISYIFDVVRVLFPSLWIGVNFLDIDVRASRSQLQSVLHTMHGLQGLWMDTLPREPLGVQGVRMYGNVAFKHRDALLCGDALKSSCDEAVRVVDVVVTSGNKTGSPPSIEKLSELSGYVDGRTPLVVASGVDVSNVGAMLPFVKEFFVATSVLCPQMRTGEPEYFDGYKVRELAEAIHSR